MLTTLYFSQGLPFGFQVMALPLYLRENGASLAGLSLLVGALSAPWMFKALWAPLIDEKYSRVIGRRKSWIIPLQLLMMSVMFAIYCLEPGNVKGLLVGIFILNLLTATQDIAVDGLAVDLLKENELGLGNTAQVAGYKVGMVMSGGFLVYLVGDAGWQNIFLLMAAFASLPLLLLFKLQEKEFKPEHPNKKGGPSFKEIWSHVVSSFKAPHTAVVIILIGTYKLGESLIDPMFRQFLFDSGFPKSEIGLWLGMYGMPASILGSIAGGYAASKFRIWPTLGVALLLRAIPIGGEWLLTTLQPSANQVILVSLTEHFFGGALTTVMFAYMMSKVDKAIGATHFTILASIENLGKSPGSWLSGVSSQYLGYSFTFAVGLFLSVLVVWPWYRAKE